MTRPSIRPQNHPFRSRPRSPAPATPAVTVVRDEPLVSQAASSFDARLRITRESNGCELWSVRGRFERPELLALQNALSSVHRSLGTVAHVWVDLSEALSKDRYDRAAALFTLCKGANLRGKPAPLAA